MTDTARDRSRARLFWHPRVLAGAVVVAAAVAVIARAAGLAPGWTVLACWLAAGASAGFAASGST
ncbi:hypothetical protein ACPPVO_05465 [Dactylosporangium sp. McL0621]|uniref:hypothetical protein n=1 Tax=Dactylosporangium sp. McL0621 TaxID=3415678 RepID=UPI003CF1B226